MNVLRLFRPTTPPEPPPPPAASSVRVGPVVTRETLDRYAAAYSIGFQLIRQARPLESSPWEHQEEVA